MMRRALLCLVGVWLTLSLAAQTERTLHHYDSRDGLSHNSVSCILQDSRGFLWFGTRNGLNRFDGADFKVFRRQEKDIEGSLCNSFINDITETPDGCLWIATDDGVSVFDPMRELFIDFTAATTDGKQVQGHVLQVEVDKNGCLWFLCDEGLFLFCSGELIDMMSSTSPALKSVPTAMCIDGTMAFLASEQDGIVSCECSGRVSQIADNGGGIPSVLNEYGPGQLLLGTRDKGLFIVDRAYGTLHPVPTEEISPGVGGLYFRSITRISNTEYWIGSESGLWVLRDGVLTMQWNREKDAVRAVCKDSKGGIWVGNYYSGLDYFTEKRSFVLCYYPSKEPGSICGKYVRDGVEDADGKVWIGTEDHGVCVWDPSSDEFSPILTSNGNTLSDINVQCIKLIGDELWIATYGTGIYIYNTKTRSLRHCFGQEDIIYLYNGRDGTIWAGGTWDLFTVNPTTGEGTRYPLDTRSFISCIFEDNHDNLWVATFVNGIFCIDRKTGETYHFVYEASNANSIGYGRVTCGMMDSNGRLWFGTDDGGLSRYDVDSQSFTRVTTTDGLPVNAVYSIVEDADRYLWLGTSNGLVQFDPDGMQVKTVLHTADGLPTEHFIHHAGGRLRNGFLAFGCVEGAVSFDPITVVENERHHTVTLTGLFLSNHEVKTGKDNGKEILDAAFPYTTHIRLHHDEATFTLTFSTLDFESEGTGMFAYRLEGFDRQWNYVNNVNRISYHNVPPGQYVLNIRAVTSITDESDTTTSIAITVTPPWWKTLPVRIASALLILSLLALGGGLFMRDKRQREKQRQQEEEQERIRLDKERDAEVYRAKIDFFTNIAHEIRTPVSLIKAPLGLVMHKDLSNEQLKENLTTINLNVDRLNVLINQLLDFRKVESGAVRLAMQPTDVGAVVQSVWDRFMPTAHTRRLTAELQLPAESVIAMLDAEATTKIVSNMMTNALKYCDTYIRISLTHDKAQGMLRITSNNDGARIPENMRDLIFQPFVQVKDRDLSRPGSGIGLALASSLATLQGGTLTLNGDAPDNEFVLELPAVATAGEEGKDISTQIKRKDDDAPLPLIHTTSGDGNIPVLLIVEDDDEMRQFLAKQLGYSYNVLQAADGVEALKVLDREIVSLVISDVMMPRKDGMELCRDIRANIETCHLPVILLTAKADVGSAVEGLEHGADAYISKPFELEFVEAQVASLLTNRRILQEKFAGDPLVKADIMVNDKADQRFLEALTTYINDNLANSELNVDQLASEMNMSRSTLHRKIKAVTGQTPNDFIRLMRLKQAASLLSTGKYQSGEVCMLVGFNSHSYFAKIFQQQFGLAPKEFADSHKSQ